MSEALKWIGGAVVALAIIAALVIGGQRFGWWLQEYNVEKKAHIYRVSFANQERLREDASEKAAEVTRLEVTLGELGAGGADQARRLEASIKAITAIACHDIGQITEATPEVEAFAAANCSTVP
jgi:hypothetical protein